MRPGRSSCSGALVLALAALLVPGFGGDAAAQPIPPPPENDSGDAPPPPPPVRRGASASEPRPAARPAPRVLTCPRCGYLCEPAWSYCAACGWDLTAPVDAAEEALLLNLARTTVGVVIPGRPNRYATAFPFGGPDLYLTHARMVRGATANVRLRLHNNREYDGVIVAVDPPSGAALIKAAIPGVSPPQVAPVTPAPGEMAWAVCYPVLLEGDFVRYLPVSVHRGRVTSTGQSGTAFVSFENLLRTDHAVEVGCIGAPLMDARGRLAGLIHGGPDDGITYATPLADLAAVVPVLARGESVPRPYFGIGLVNPDERRRVKFGVETSVTQPLVAYVIPDGPAARAGVRAGDVVTAVGGRGIATVREAGAALLAGPADGGAPLTLTVRRGGEVHEIAVTPRKRPDRVVLDPVDEMQETLEANLKEVASGNGKPELVVADLVRGGRGEKLHFQNGDVIVGVDNRSVRTAQDVREAIHHKFKEIFGAEKRASSSYLVTLEIRPAGKDKVKRYYANGFPDFLAPPVY